MAIFNLATSLKFSSKDQRSHFKLAALLEEKSFIESLYGFEKKVKVFFFVCIQSSFTRAWSNGFTY
jgi:hypothetical protein